MPFPGTCRSLVSKLVDSVDLQLKNYGLPAIIDVMTVEVPYKDVSMLLTFRAENVRSFRDELELSLLATALAEKDVPQSVPWREGGRPIRVLPAAGIFGANASGKSNLLGPWPICVLTCCIRSSTEIRLVVCPEMLSGWILPGRAFRRASRWTWF